MKRIIAGLLVVTTLLLPILNIAAYDFEITDERIPCFFAERLYGKVFYGGVNEEVNSATQLDTTITNVKIYNQSGNARLEFDFGGSRISIGSFLIESTINNVDKAHYVFSPKDFNHDVLEIVVLKLTTNANEYDLMPVNYDLKGKTVLSIIMKDKSSRDVYYWQGEMQSRCASTKGLPALSETIEDMRSFNISAGEYDRIVNAANEEYYRDSEPGNFSLSAEELEKQVPLLTSTIIDSNRSIDSADPSDAAVTRAESNNPFYESDGIPNSVFQSVTNKWTQHVAWRQTVNNKVISMNYYTYSYQNYGDSNIYTLIMLLKFTETKIEMGSTPTAMKRLEIEVAANETIVYYTNYGVYDYGLGLNDLVDFYPAIEIAKTGTAVNHILTTRMFGGEGYKNANILASIEQAASILVGIIDGALTGGAITTTISVLDLAYSSTTPTSQKLGCALYNFGLTVDDQLENIGRVVGSVKVEMDGFLRSPENYFFVQAEFAANNATTAARNTWKLYYSID